jgi:hypothetical protein
MELERKAREKAREREREETTRGRGREKRRQIERERERERARRGGGNGYLGFKKVTKDLHNHTTSATSGKCRNMGRDFSIIRCAACAGVNDCG